MSGSGGKQISIGETEEGRWFVQVTDPNGRILDQHVLDARPSNETVRTLIEEADRHHDALERLVHR